MAIEAYKMDVGGLSGGSWTQFSIVFRVDNSADEPSYIKANELLQDFDADQLADLCALFPNTYVIKWLRARRISAGGGHSLVREYPGTAAIGTGVGTGGSLSLAPVVKLICGLNANTQGRIFLPCVAEANFLDNVYDSAYVTLVSGMFAQLISWTGSVSATEWNIAVWSPKQTNVFTVLAVQVSNIIGNIKRRRVPR